MTTQLYLAHGIVRGRVHTGQDHALQRSAELALQSERDAHRSERRAARRARRHG